MLDCVLSLTRPILRCVTTVALRRLALTPPSVFVDDVSAGVSLPELAFKLLSRPVVSSSPPLPFGEYRPGISLSGAILMEELSLWVNPPF